MKSEEVDAIFILAGIPVEKKWELANKYWPDTPEYADIRSKNPWWLVQTPYGMVEIGWRKRVIQIDWSDTKFRGIVTPDQVTQEETLVHAWSYSKAVAYMTDLKRMIIKNVAEAGEL